MHVTMLSSELNPRSGWGMVTHALCLGFSRRTDVTFTLLLPSGAETDGSPFVKHVRKVLPVWVPSLSRRPLSLFSYCLPRIRLERTDVIHAAVEFPYAITAWRLARRAAAPFVVSTQGTYGVVPFSRGIDAALYRGALAGAAEVTAASAFTAGELRRASGLSRDVRVVHVPVDVERFRRAADPARVRARLGLPAGARIVLSVGELKERKGFDILIRALPEVVAREPDACLVIAGGGGSRDLAAMARDLGMASRVHFPGAVSGDDLVGLFQACEVFALLPRNDRHHFEGFGIVYLEAGACGKPVVGARTGGVPDAVRDGETGILVDEGDHDTAAAAIVSILRDPGLAAQMGAAGARWAEAHDVDRFAQSMLDVYRDAAAAPRRAIR